VIPGTHDGTSQAAGCAAAMAGGNVAAITRAARTAGSARTGPLWHDEYAAPSRLPSGGRFCADSWQTPDSGSRSQHVVRVDRPGGRAVKE
jgi:hypothetical protein